jgi:hypothetical protein
MAINKRLIAGAPTGGGGACTTNTLQILGDSSCIAYYKMADATDESGSHNGTPTSVDFNVEGKYGLAGGFNGSSSKIVLPNSSFQTSAFTVSAWCNVTANGSENSIFEFTDTNSGNNQSTVLLSAGNASNSSRFLIRNTTSNEYSHAPSGTPATGWNHYCLTFDGSTAKSYINGSEVNSASFSITNTIASTSEVLLGLSATDRFLNGKIDQVRIFNKAVSASEVGKLYAEVQCASAVTPSEHFNTVLFTGNGASGRTVNVGFEPALIWQKFRNFNYDHQLMDSVRSNFTELLQSNSSAAENTNSGVITSTSSTGFTTGTSGIVTSAYNMVFWNWYAPTSETNNAGSNGATIASTIKKNVDAGFSIVSYNGATNATSDGSNNSGVGWNIGHGLSVAPSLIIIKKTNNTASWYVGADGISSNPWTTGNGQHLVLDESYAKSSPGGSTKIWNSAPTATTFNVGGWDVVNRNGDSYIAYCFHSVEGYSRIGSYTGNDGTTNIVTGFEPAWIMIKCSSNGGTNKEWNIFDNKRDTSPLNNRLEANTSDSETTDTSNIILNTNGFTIADNGTATGSVNQVGFDYIFMAFAQDPDTTPATKADSFDVITYTGNGGTQSTNSLSNQSGSVSFKPDFVWFKRRSDTEDNAFFDSVRGVQKQIVANKTNAESTKTNALSSFDSNGFTMGANNALNTNNQTYVAWNWKAADHDRGLATINQDGSITSLVSANQNAGFSIVKTTSPSSTINFNYGHGLSQAPELVMVKTLNIASYWEVIFPDTFGSVSGSSSPSNWNRIKLNESDGVMSSNAYLAADGTKIYNGAWQANTELINYCFHSVDGYQKVGSYAGSGAANKQITTGFLPSFLMIKNITSSSSTGWVILDTARDGTTENGNALFANSSGAEWGASNTTIDIDFTATGFTIQNGYVVVNGGSDTYIYLAIA